jgi:predicted DNA-binding transcriptional regulator YafY
MPTLDWEAVKKLAAMLIATPMSIEDMKAACGISQRTAYRWIDELERRGYDVVRRRSQGAGTPFLFEIRA